MFLGTFTDLKVDRRRLALPKKIRQEVAGDRVVITSGFEDKCIIGFEESVWEDTSKQELVNPIKDREARKVRRQMFANASVEEFDEQGRFVVPEHLAKFADIQTEATVIGGGDHFEIWNPDVWKKYSAQEKF